MNPFPYRITVGWSERDEAFVAKVPAFPGAGGDGDTEAAAIESAKQSVAGFIEVMKQHGDAIPPSDLESVGYSGQLRVRMPRSLHRELAVEAEREGVSLNQLIVTVLASRGARTSSAPSSATTAVRWVAGRKKATR